MPGASAGYNRLTVRVAGHAAVDLGSSNTLGGPTLAVGNGGQAVVGWMTDAAEAMVALAQPDGTWATTDLGKGRVDDVAMNAAGDAVLVMTTGSVAVAVPRQAAANTLVTRFRPAGGAFGDAVTLPGESPAGLALSPSGEAFVGVEPQYGNPRPWSVVSRLRDDAVSAPTTLGTDVVPQLVADAHGRALAVWWTYGDRAALFTSVRSAAGDWSPPARRALAGNVDALDARVDDAGDAVIAWRDDSGPDQYAGPLQVATGSLGGAFGDPVTLNPGPGTLAQVAEATDGSAVILETDPLTRATRVYRRAGTGAFAPPQIAVCGAGFLAGIADDGRATILHDNALVSDAESATPAERTCPAAPPHTPSLGLQGTAVVGKPVTVHPDVLRPDFTGSAQVDFDGDGATEPADHFTFTTPGAHRVVVHSGQCTTYDGMCTSFEDPFTVEVFAPQTLRAAAQLRRAVLRHGLRVTANAFAADAARPVTLRVHRWGTHARPRADAPRRAADGDCVHVNRAGRRYLRAGGSHLRVALRQPGHRSRAVVRIV